MLRRPTRRLCESRWENKYWGSVQMKNVTLIQEAADKEEETTPGRRARRSAATAAKLAMSYQVLLLAYS